MHNDTDRDRRPPRYFAFSLIGGSSQPCGPKCGMTIDWPSLLLNGFEYVHSDFPSVDSHAPLITVRPGTTEKLTIADGNKTHTRILTFDVHARRADDLEVDDVLGRGAAREHGRRVEEDVLVGDAERAVGHATRGRVLRARARVAALERDVLANRDLVDEARCNELAENLELCG